jgi:hypothetical protein
MAPQPCARVALRLTEEALMSENKELDAALLKLETRHRFESFLKKLGASEEAAKLIASSPDQIAKVAWDGVNLHFGKSDLAAVDDPAAGAHFLDGPFKGLFVAPADKADGHDNTQFDEALVASARAGNITAKGQLLRSLNGDVEALNAALADKGNGDDKGANGHDKSLLNGSSNPFFKLRRPDGTIDKAAEKDIGRMIAVMGHKKVADIARAAKSPAAPLGLSLTGLPLKP